MSETEQPLDSELRDAEVYIQNKNVTAVWILLLTQLFYCFMYGFFIKISPFTITTSEGFIHTAFLFILIVAGFGMALSRPYKLIWSHLGFNILIAALSIQTFFLVNAFWTKAGIYHNSPFNTQSYFVGLIPTDINNPGTNSSQGANLNEALKCALACIIAFSFVIGRAGLLDLYVLTTTGTVVYELARQVCINNYPEEIGSIKIFLYGGVLGLITSFVMTKLGKEGNIVDHPNHQHNRTSLIFSLLGTIFVWVLFPLLARDTFISGNLETNGSRVIAIYLATSSAGLLSIFLGSFKFGFKLVTYSVIGAGVAILSASAYISNPVYAVVFGLASAVFQFIFCFIVYKWERSSGPIDPNYFAFVGQGFFGIFLATINRGIVYSNSNRLSFDWTNIPRSEYILGNGAITLGMALALGFVIGSLLSCCTYHEEIDQYTDHTYWLQNDGLSKHQPIIKEEEHLWLHEQNVSIKQKNAYL